MFIGLVALPAGAQTPSDPNRPAGDTTTSSRQDRSNDHDYGWLGLLGLAGLGGLMRRQHTHDRVLDTRQTSSHRS